MMKPQTEKVLNILKKNGKLTTAQAERKGINRLSARICELRENGFNIESKRQNKTTTRVSYVMA